MELHLAVLCRGDHALFQQAVVEIVQPHLLHHIPPLLLVGQILRLPLLHVHYLHAPVLPSSGKGIL